MKKRGQFFILASVILSLSLFGMAFTINQVLANEPDVTFTDFADGVERETNGMLDYFVYSNIETENIEDFILKLEADFQDQERGGNFMFIYGNNSRIVVKNLGTQGIGLESLTDKLLQGSSGTVESDIRLGGFSLSVSNFISDNTLEINYPNIPEEISIVFNEQVYKFPVTKVNQVIFIIQKDISGETYVEVR